MTLLPPSQRDAALAGAIALAALWLWMLASCGGQPGTYDRSLEPPVLGLDWCARALTDDGETVQLCASEAAVCRYAVGLARRFGRSWVIRPARLRIGAVSGCEKRPQIEIDVQRVELR